MGASFGITVDITPADIEWKPVRRELMGSLRCYRNPARLAKKSPKNGRGYTWLISFSFWEVRKKKGILALVFVCVCLGIACDSFWQLKRIPSIFCVSIHPIYLYIAYHDDDCYLYYRRYYCTSSFFLYGLHSGVYTFHLFSLFFFLSPYNRRGDWVM